MSHQTPACAHCGRTSDEVPLMTLNFKDRVAWICPQHLPILIHKPQNLVGKVPGVENLSAEGHSH
ncbi:MAG: hypothetical protein ACK2T5_16375 [Anaerolineales bacterium]|jgi:hypothetical protein